jgi:hypothetical protein
MDSKQSGKPLDPTREPIMRDGRTFSEHADELAAALVAGLNARVIAEHGAEPDDDPERDALIKPD